MSITAMDIQQQGFEHSLRGYDVEQVDDFLERVATEVGEMTKEIDDLKAQLAAAPQASQAVEQPASGEADRIAQAEAAAKAAAAMVRHRQAASRSIPPLRGRRTVSSACCT